MALPTCNCFPRLMINKAGRNSLTPNAPMSLIDPSRINLSLRAITP